MTKQNIIITGYEDSEDKSRTRFNTNAGWMSAFKNEGETLIADLKAHTETLICVDAVASKQVAKNGKPYVNIRAYFGEVDESTLQSPVVETKPMTEQTFETNKVEHSVSVRKNKEMYIAFAKDLFIAMSGKETSIETPQLMDLAIELVKQAEEAF